MKTVKLSDICTVFKDGDWIESKDQSESGIRLIQTGNIGVGTFRDRVEKARWISDETFKKLRCTEVREGDVLISRLPDPVGRACLLPKLEHKAITAVDCAIVRFNEEILDPRFFVYYSQSSTYSASVAPLISGSTRERISREKLGTIMIPVPTLKEQRTIVEKLDSAFAEIADLVASVDVASSLIDQMMLSALDNYLNKGSAQSRIGDICTVTSSKRIFKSEYVQSGIPFYRTKELKELANRKKIKTELFISKARFSEIKEKYGIPNNGDILISAVGTIGEVLIVDNLGDFYFKDGNIVWLKSISEDFNSEFLVMCLKNITKALNDVAKGSAYNALTIEKLVDIEIPRLSIPEQVEIVNKFNALSKAIFEFKLNLKKEKELVFGLRQSLLEEAFAQEEAVA